MTSLSLTHTHTLSLSLSLNLTKATHEDSLARRLASEILVKARATALASHGGRRVGELANGALGASGLVCGRKGADQATHGGVDARARVPGPTANLPCCGARSVVGPVNGG